MRKVFFTALLISCTVVWAQSPSATPPAGSQPQTSPPSSSPDSTSRPPSQPPRPGGVNAQDLGDDTDGVSSSKDTQMDLSAPADDDKAHPQSAEAVMDAELGNGEATEFHPWDPHKAAKDIEVGDFYFKRQNYRAAESRYREALLYKPNDALATFRLASSLEKLDMPEAARKEYQRYLQILPHGPQAEDARKALDRLNGASKNPVGNKPTH